MARFRPLVQSLRCIRDRPKGSRNTTKEEDKKIIATFHKVRPPGRYVDSRMVSDALPKKISKKIGRRTIIRRLAEKGYVPTPKVDRSDPGPALMKLSLIHI